MPPRFAALTALMLCATPLAAGSPEAPVADTPVAQPATAPSRALVFSLRGGVAVAPAYFGSDEYELGPDIGFSFKYLSFGNGRTFGNPDPWADSLGFGLGGSFGFVGARDASEYDELTGLDDVDAAVELGVSASYTMQNFTTFAAVRRGFGGHEGWVAEAGADVIARPSDRWRLTLGPRVLWGDDTYADTYFGVTPAEAGPLPAYDAEAGLISAGIEFGARYQINDDWGLEGAITYEGLTGDAKNSPITGAGSSEQWKARLGVTRVFRIGG